MTPTEEFDHLTLPSTNEYAAEERIHETPVKGYVPMTLHREAHPQDPIMKKSTINSGMEAVLL